MKKLLLASVLALPFLLSGEAQAQNPQCPTRPSGDSSNACASTAFVHNAAAPKVPGVVVPACTGVIDDTAIVQAAITAAGSGGEVNVGTTNCLISGSGTAIFTLTDPITIKGIQSSPSGAGGGFIIATGVPNTRDLFRIIGVTNQTYRGWHFRGLTIREQSGCVGKNVIHFDSTAGTTTGFAEVVIDDVTITACSSAGGSSISFNNGASINVNGGTFNATVRNSWLAGGIQCLKCGDSIRSEFNILTGDNPGIYLDQVSGAGGFESIGDNNTALGGCFVIKTAIAPKISSGICEIIAGSTTTNVNLALVDIQGPVVGGNISSQVQAGAGTNVTSLVRIANASNFTVGNSTFGEQAAITAVRIINTSTQICITAANYYTGGGTDLVDNGIIKGCFWPQFQDFKNGIFVEGATLFIDAAHVLGWGSPFLGLDSYIYGEATNAGITGLAHRIFNGGSSNSALNFSCDTNSCPSLVQNGTTIKARLAAGGGDAPFTTGALTVTGSFTATGLVTNGDLANPATTVNSQTCTLGSTCTVTVPISTGVTGLGTGVATWLATPSAANFGSAITGALSTTKTVRAAGGAADCTLIFTGGLLTGGSC